MKNRLSSTCQQAGIDPIGRELFPTGGVVAIRSDRAEREVPSLLGRLVYPGSVQLLGLWAYLARHLRDGGELLGKLLADDGADPVRFPSLDLYSAVMDLPAEVFLDIMRHVYQERTLVRGKFRARNQTVALRSIRATALMTVEGEHDDIAAPGQTQRVHDLCPCIPADTRRQLVVPACGHFSLFHGEIWRSRVLPEVRVFIDRFGRTGSRTTR